MTSIIEKSQYFTSLPRDYYVSEAIFEREKERVFRRSWLYAGHVSQLRESGDFFARDIGTESMILTRDPSGAVRAFFNVCRHRGAQLCPSGSAGRARQIVCPYHHWSYGTDGHLKRAPGMRDGVDMDLRDWPLHEARCETFFGSIWVWLGKDADQAPSLAQTLEPRVNDIGMLTRVEPERTKIAHEEQYTVKANWKLLLENNCECYHCAGGHPSLAIACDYTGFFGAPDEETPQLTGSTKHFPLREGMKTFSMDGDWVCKKPLGTGFSPDFSCGYITVPVFAGPVYFADHGVNLDIVPLDKDTTRLIAQWFVHEDAVEGVDYDVQRLIEVFHVTNIEDGKLAELNQRGINSYRFVPGPNHPTREPFIRAALNTYLELLGDPLTQ